MSFDLNVCIAAPSTELLNLAKKTDYLDIADHYGFTSDNRSMLKHEIKNILIQFFVDEGSFDSSILSNILITQTDLQMRELEINRQTEIEKLKLEHEERRVAEKAEREERIRIETIQREDRLQRETLERKKLKIEMERQMHKERIELEERENENKKKEELEREERTEIEKVKLKFENEDKERDIQWATSWENLFLPYANNKGADQPVHPRSQYNIV